MSNERRKRRLRQGAPPQGLRAPAAVATAPDTSTARSQELPALRQQLEIVKSIPAGFNYRDYERGTREWRRYLTGYPEHVEAAQKWAYGPILICGPVTPAANKLYQARIQGTIEPHNLEWEQFPVHAAKWQRARISVIYVALPSLARSIPTGAFNALCRYWNFNFRFRSVET